MGRAPYGLTFETFSPVERSQHLRADVALFVGFVAPRATESAAPRDPADEEPLRAWLRHQGFGERADQVEAARRSVATLEQVPIPIESWSTFDRLFAWDDRPIARGTTATTYLGAAVRAFFAQGGRKAYVVRAGLPWSKGEAPEGDAAREALREGRLWSLIPDATRYRPDGEVFPTPLDRSTWRGVTHLFGLADVSFVLLPDLPDVLDARPVRQPPVPPAREEVFVTCSDEGTDTPESLLSQIPPPACDAISLRRWAEVVSSAVSFVRRHRPEAQLLAAIPLVLEDDTGGARISSASPLGRFYEERWLRVRQSTLGATTPALEPFTSAFLQLATPWVKTLGSARSPGEVEPPDGTLAGVLARNALTRGTFRSAAAAPVPFVFDFAPDYGRGAMLAPIDARTSEQREPLNLLQRACVFGRAPSGIQLLSDVTTSADESYRSAGASRLLGAVLRAARAIGDDVAFEASNEATWANVRRGFEGLLRELWQRQALRGATEEEAFQVRCDRSTMTQSDIDAGRMIVHVQIEAAIAVEAIRVVLSLTEGGRVALLTTERAS